MSGDLSFERTPVTLALLCVIIGFSAFTLWLAPKVLGRHLLRPYWLLKRRDYITIITSGFIHGDVGHLFFNSLTLYFFGPALEARIGSPRFLALYLTGLIVSSLGTVYKQRNNPDYAALGASGAILAVLFAYIVYFPKAMLGLYFVIPVPAVVFAFGYVAYSWWASKHQRDNINHDAHLDGALTGLIFVGLTDFAAWKHAFEKVLG